MSLGSFLKLGVVGIIHSSSKFQKVHFFFQVVPANVRSLYLHILWAELCEMISLCIYGSPGSMLDAGSSSNLKTDCDFQHVRCEKSWFLTFTFLLALKNRAISMMDPHVPFHQLAMKGGYSHNVDKTHDIVWFILCVYVYIYIYILYIKNIYTVYMNKYVYYLWTKHSDNIFYRVPDEIPWSEPAVLYLSLSGNGPRISHPWIIHFVMDFVSYPLVNV